MTKHSDDSTYFGVITLVCMAGIIYLGLFLAQIVVDKVEYGKFNKECRIAGELYLDKYPATKIYNSEFYYNQLNDVCMGAFYKNIDYTYIIETINESSTSAFICAKDTLSKNKQFLGEDKYFSGYVSQDTCNKEFNESIEKIKDFKSRKRLI